MLLNILFVLAIIWLTFSIASILVGMYYTYTVVLPYLIDWDSVEEPSTTKKEFPEVFDKTPFDDDLPF